MKTDPRELAQAFPSAAARQAQSALARFRVLGVRVDAVQTHDVVARMEARIAERAGCHFIVVTGMHGVVESQRDSSFKNILNSADLVVPDGMPMVWLGRRQRHSLRRRVCGPDLMEAFCQATGPRYRHFFYGGAPGVAADLAKILSERYGLRVAGYCSPPFRALTKQEDKALQAQIEEAAPDVLWVGLGTPKQERWMHDHQGELKVPVAVGVGAAFDFVTGRVKRAPSWMQENGLEWFFRLTQEPRRLWRRYLIYGSVFAWNVSLELLGLKKFQ
jgi:N-acetylglucosaminyldiphosphoundecaprenol N-acetyl-beta-D-mannosaminyltransferase